MLQSSSKAKTEMYPLDFPQRRLSKILASFTVGAVGSGEEPDDSRVRSKCGDGLLSICKKQRLWEAVGSQAGQAAQMRCER